MKRAIVFLFVVVLAGGLALAAVDAAAQHNPGAGAAASDTEATTAEARRADLAVFRDQFFVSDASYSEAARAEAQARLQALEAEAGEVSQAYFELELSRIVALADNGHTILLPGARAAHFNRVPIRLTRLNDGFYVMRTAPEYTDLLGAKLTAIDGNGMDALLPAARFLLGGVDVWRERAAPALLESPEQLHALGLAQRGAAAQYEFELAGGQTLSRDLAGAPPPAPQMTFAGLLGHAWLTPETSTDAASEMVLAVSDAPWTLREHDRAFRSRAATDLDAYVLQIRQISNSDAEPIADALARFETEIAAAAPQHVILDMRSNHGGDLNTARDFMQRLPEMVPGRIFVFTDEGTFSAAISSIGYLKQAGGERVTIVGAPVGDRLNFFAEGGLVRLPHSQAFLLQATERHDYVTGCQGYEDCHGSVVRNPIAVESLAPDFEAPWTMEAYRAGRDPAMDAVAAALR